MLDTYRHKVVLIGDGAVGSSFAFSLLQSTNEVDELVLVDRTRSKAVGDAADLADITPLTNPVKIYAGTYEDAADADVVVITAGIPRKPGETRLDLVNKNTTILKSIIEPIVKSGFTGVFVISSNPVDILTTIAQRISGFPKERVIGTGTSLDSMRLRVLLSKKLHLSVNVIDALMLGEHGDTSFAAFNEITIGGKALNTITALSNIDKSEIEKAVHEAGSQIIANKGATFYGIAKCLSYITRAIIENRNLVLPISAPLDGQYGLKGLYLGTPAIINSQGIGQVVEYPLTSDEVKKMQQSAEAMHQVLAKIEI